MLTKVEIQNFQSHKNTVLDLVPGVNVIVGLSDSGKSAILRAIRWTLSNRPLGDAFRSEWGGDTRVSIHTDDGHIVERLRTDNDNLYILDGKELRAFGTEPPEDVGRILRIDEACIQSQMDPPFLLALSPGDAARMLNKAASLDDIDHCISNLRKMQSSIANELKLSSQEFARYQEVLSRYDFLSQVEALLEEADKLQQRIVPKADKVSRLYHLTESRAAILEVLKDFENLDRAKRHAEQAESILHRIDQKKVAITKLDKLARGAREITVKLEHKKARLRKLEEEFHSLMPDVCPLCGQVVRK